MDLKRFIKVYYLPKIQIRDTDIFHDPASPTSNFLGKFAFA